MLRSLMLLIAVAMLVAQIAHARRPADAGMSAEASGPARMAAAAHSA
jgi:hypothetical protein